MFCVNKNNMLNNNCCFVVLLNHDIKIGLKLQIKMDLNSM